ncbi:hypothetical protein PG987_003589 [Apiospora arundinis]
MSRIKARCLESPSLPTHSLIQFPRIPEAQLLTVTYRKFPFSNSQDYLYLTYAKLHGYIGWSSSTISTGFPQIISSDLAREQSPLIICRLSISNCSQHSTAAMSSDKRERRWWTEEEDQILKAGVESQIKQVGNVNSLMSWNEIAALLPRRTNKDCRKRWYKVRSDFVKGAWSHEEDRKLKQAVQRYGLKWSLVSRDVESRNADQCAKRWQHGLRPDLKHTPWQPEEDAKLLQAMEKHGNKWKMIGTLDLPNRSRASYLAADKNVFRKKGPGMGQTPASQHANNGKLQSHSDDENDEDEFATECEEDDVCDDYDDSGISVVSAHSQLQSPALDFHMDSGFTSEAASPRSMQALFIQEDSEMTTAGNHDWNGLAMLQEQLLKTEQLQHLQHLQQMQATPPTTPISSTWYGLPGASDAASQHPSNGYASYLPMNVMPYPTMTHNSMTEESYLGMFDNYVHPPDVGALGFRPQVNPDWPYEIGYRADPFGG